MDNQGIADGQLIITGWKSIQRALGDCTDYRKAKRIAADLKIKIVYLDRRPCVSVREVQKKIANLMRE